LQFALSLPPYSASALRRASARVAILSSNVSVSKAALADTASSFGEVVSQLACQFGPVADNASKKHGAHKVPSFLKGAGTQGLQKTELSKIGGTPVACGDLMGHFGSFVMPFAVRACPPSLAMSHWRAWQSLDPPY
jgi:hypothetical protein